MKPRRPDLLLVLAICCSLSKLDSVACSVVMGYVRPTNYELVKEADAIVLANAIAFEKKGEIQRSGKSFGIFKFKVLERIKGDFNDEFISVAGDNAIRSWGDPNDFSFTKGDHGPCNPTDYELKGNYVLFLQNWKGKWSVGGPPFTRVNVLVEGTNSPWADAVRQYARVAKLNDYEPEKSGLRDVRSRALAREAGFPRALVADIDAHFTKPTPAKSFADLRALYEHAKDADTREYVLWACARGEKRDAAELFRSLLQSGEWLNYIHPVCNYAARVKLSGFHTLFATALTTNQTGHERRMLLIALAGSAESPEQNLMQKVLESVSKQETELLADWFVKHPSQEAINYFTKLASSNYIENFQQTLALAGMGDTNVVNWAKQFITKPGDDRWLGFYVFATSPLPIADEVARQMIHKGKSEDLVSLVQGYDDSKRPDRLERLREIVRSKSKSQKLIFWLRRILGNMAFSGDKEAEKLLNELPVVAEPKD